MIPALPAQAIRAALDAAAGKYANGQTTDEYMRWLRGDWAP